MGPTYRTPRRLLLLPAAILGIACSSSSPLPPFDGSIALGTWGGDTTGMIVGDTAMHLHIGCTYGDVSGRIPVDSRGRFDVGGSYMLRAYPVAVGPSMPARFVGQVEGANATLTVTINDTITGKTTVKGPVMVRYGDPPQMGPCPICRRPIITKRSPHK